MFIERSCPACGIVLRIDSAHAGRDVRCPECQAVFAADEDAVRGAEFELSRPTSPAVPASPSSAADDLRLDAAPPVRWRLRTPEGLIFGPVTTALVEQWIQEGRVSHDCQLRQEHQASWVFARQLYPGLARIERTFRPEKAPGSPATPFVHTHRGTIVMCLALTGLITMCFPLSLIAWVMATQDLRRMDNRQMDRQGYGITQASRWIASVHLLLSALILVVLLLVGIAISLTQ